MSTPTPSKNIKHVIKKYKHRLNEVTCECDWVGTRDEYEKHKAEMRKAGDIDKGDKTKVWRDENQIRLERKRKKLP